MAISRTTTALVASIRRRCFMKPQDPDFTTQDIIDMLNEQVGAYLYDLMRPFAQGYAIQTEDQPLVIAQQDYLVPVRAVNGTIEAQGIIDPTGNTTGYKLVTYDLQDSVLLQDIAAAIVPVAVSYLSNVVRLWPAPGSPQPAQNTLRIQYMQRASELVPLADVGVVSSIGGSAGAYTVTLEDTPPAAFVSGAVMEFVRASPNYSTLTPTGTITNVAGNVVTVDFDSLPAAPQAPAAGDYLCIYDQAPVLTNVPLEFQECLLQWVALKMMEAKGDQGAMERLGKTLGVVEGNLRKQLSQRSTGQRRFMNAWTNFAGAPVRGQLWPLSQPGP